MKKYKSEMRMVMHQDAVSLHKAGAMSDEEMRHFDEACLVKPAAPVSRVSPQKRKSNSAAPVYARGK